MDQTPLNILPDSDYANRMTHEVEPFLSGIQRSGYLSLSKPSPEQTLYYESFEIEHAKGAVVISHGFSETIEKYREVIYYFVKAGFCVYLADHRGHGRSYRETAHPNRIHIHHFEDYVTDLHAFVTAVVQPAAQGLPLFLYAHSMGGAVGALYLETHPGIFQRAVLTSPMLSISLGTYPAAFARLFCGLMVLLGKGDSYAPGQHDYLPGESFEESASSSPQRFLYYKEKKEINPLFQLSGSSYGWVFQSLRAATKILSRTSTLTIPILVFQAQNDAFVKKEGILRFVKKVPSATHILIPGSKHEIYNSSAYILPDYYRKIFCFFTEES